MMLLEQRDFRMTKLSRWMALTAVTLLAGACSISTSQPNRRPAGYSGPPPGAPPPQPAPAPAAANPLTRLLSAGGVLRLPPPPPSRGVFRPINVRSLVASLNRSPCRPEEVSAGNWVGFDCTPPRFIMRAGRFMPPRGQVSSFGPTGSVGALPDGVDNRSSGMEGPMKNQGAVGTCTAVSLSSAMEHGYRRLGLTDTLSALHIWSQYKVPEMGQAGDSTLDKRITVEQTWPYDPKVACKMMRRSFDSCGAAYDVQANSADGDPQIQSKKQQADQAGQHQLIGVEKIGQHDPAAFAAIIAGGDDLWVAFNVNRGAWKDSGMTNHVIPDYATTDSSGHAVVLSGYRTVGGIKQFLIHNSWGTDWGDQGYAWISENMVRNQLRYAYRVRVGHPSAPGQPNPGQPTPGSGGCPAGQAMDLVYGQCAPACPGGAQPAAGLCAPAIPGMPGSQPAPGQQPAPSSGGQCPQGQAPDLLNGQCTPVCPGGLPATGGMCLPQLQ